MTKVFAPFIILSLLCSLGYADTNGDPSPTTGARGGKRIGGKRNYIESAGKNPDTIRGNCAIIESSTNPLASACVNLLLILNDAKGDEAMRTRTSAQGQFEFTAEPDTSYKIVSGSKFYELVAPTIAIHGGDRVLVQLQQK